MSKEKQIDKEKEMWMQLMKNEPIFEKITNDITAMAMDEIKGVLDYIRSEIAAIDTNGQTGEQVKQMALDIIDNYKASIEEVE